MNDRHDIEKTLKQFRHDADGRVKQSVMSAYGQVPGAGRSAVGFWRRPIPLYAAAAVLVAMIGVSFVVGQRSAVSEGIRAETPAAADGVVTSQDLEWSVAERDLL